jgi:RND superfamily putative drug exporter
MFERWGRFVFRHRRVVLALSGILLALSIAGAASGGHLSGASSHPPGIESDRANDLLVRQVVPEELPTGSEFLLIFGSSTLSVADQEFRAALEDAVAPLQADPRVTTVTTPYSVPTLAAEPLISKDSHRALVRVELKDASNVARAYYPELRAKVRSSTLTVQGTGSVPISLAFDTTLDNDLRRAEVVSLPISLVLLLVIFGGVVAAGLPLAIGVLAIVGGLAGIFFLNRLTDVSQYAVNIVTLIGLALAIDYSLFLVNRFRDELAAGRGREEALGKTIGTTGRAIAFSGLTVAIGLGGMLFYQGTFLASLGAAGMIVVGVAVVYGLTFLSALLGTLGGGVNRLRLPLAHAGSNGAQGFWHAMALRVMRRPLVFLVPALGLLLLAGAPFFGIRLATGGVDQLPPNLEVRQGYDTLLSEFPGQGEARIPVVIHYPGGSPLTSDHVGAIYDLSRRLAALPDVRRVDGLVDVDPALGRADYQRLYASPNDSWPAPVRQLLKNTTGPNVALLTLATDQPAGSDRARALVRAIRAESPGPGGEVLVTGATAADMDVVGWIVGRTPIAVAFVVLVTCVVVFLLTRSVVLPLKAVIVNLLSITASFGALVWIFQQGHLARLLNFTPQPIDPTVPVLLFCTVFGMSMDYEVFLVSRIQEEYRRTGDNRAAVAEGLERSGRLISGAATIMFAVFVAFGLADVLIVKAIGLGLAIAVALDATVVRMLLVPAAMRLLGSVNWWAPRLAVRRSA